MSASVNDYLLALDEQERVDIYATFCASYILSRFYPRSQDTILGKMKILENIWGWSDLYADRIYKRVAQNLVRVEALYF